MAMPRRKPRAKLKGVTYLSLPELREAIAKVCSNLNGFLPPEEVAAGWTEANRVRYLELFRNLEGNLARGSGNDIPYMPIARWLDHSGVCSGQLFEDACAIDLSLNKGK